METMIYLFTEVHEVHSTKKKDKKWTWSKINWPTYHFGL